MSHNILAYKSAVDWTWVGFGVGFYTFHPKYTANSLLSLEKPLVLYVVLFSFVCTELMSLLSNIHIQTIQHYKALHPRGNPLLWIPQYHGFNKVSCANYFWKLCTWILIAFASQTFLGYAYLIWLFFELNSKA